MCADVRFAIDFGQRERERRAHLLRPQQLESDLDIVLALRARLGLLHEAHDTTPHVEQLVYKLTKQHPVAKVLRNIRLVAIGQLERHT